MREVISIHIGQAGIQVSGGAKALLQAPCGSRASSAFYLHTSHVHAQSDGLKASVWLCNSSSTLKEPLCDYRWEMPAGSSTALSTVISCISAYNAQYTFHGM